MRICISKIWALIIWIAVLSMACAQAVDQPAVSEEERARLILRDNSSGFIRCEQIRTEANTALNDVVELMEKGEWTAANKLHRSKAGPDTRKFVECVADERAVLIQKMKEGGIADATAERVYQAWLNEKDDETGANAADPKSAGNK